MRSVIPPIRTRSGQYHTLAVTRQGLQQSAILCDGLVIREEVMQRIHKPQHDHLGEREEKRAVMRYIRADDHVQLILFWDFTEIQSQSLLHFPDNIEVVPIRFVLGDHLRFSSVFEKCILLGIWKVFGGEITINPLAVIVDVGVRHFDDSAEIAGRRHIGRSVV